MATPGDGKPRSNRWIVELVGVVAVALVIAILLRTFVVATYSIPSGSMEPTLQIGDRIVVDKLAYHLHGIGRGDIVVFSTPPAENCAGPPVSNLVKRVIGLPARPFRSQTASSSLTARCFPNRGSRPTSERRRCPAPRTRPTRCTTPTRSRAATFT